MFVNGKAQQVMSNISVPSVETNLLLGQNGAMHMTGQIDEVWTEEPKTAFSEIVFCVQFSKKLTIYFIAGANMELCGQCDILLQQVFERDRGRPGQILSVSWKLYFQWQIQNWE